MNVFIGVLIGFLLGAILVCLVSSFLTQYEAFKAETEDKLKKAKKDIRVLEEKAREKELQQLELNAKYDKRIKQAEETIAALTRAIMTRETGRHEAKLHEGGKV